MPTPSNLPAHTLEQIKADLRAGNKIAAIKSVRETTGLGLADAKNVVDRLHAELHAQDPAAYPAPAARRGCLGILVAAGFVGAALVVWWRSRS